MNNEEITYFQEGNVTITNARAILAGTTYVIANTTSVSMLEINPNITIPIAAGLIGAIIGLCSFSMKEQINVGVIIGLLVIIFGCYIFFTTKPRYAVQIVSAAREVNALTSRDKDHIQKIVNALNTAIVKRG